MSPLIKIGIWLLEAVFVAGLAGSALVLLLTSIEDFEMLFEKDEPIPAETAPPE